MMYYPNTNNISQEAQKHYGESALKADAMAKLFDVLTNKIIGINIYISEKEIEDAVDCRTENEKGHCEQAKYLGQISEQEKNIRFTELDLASNALKSHLKSYLRPFVTM